MRVLCVLLLLTLPARAESLRGDPPKSPEAEAKTFAVLDGFRMELIAAEPLVASPVAMAYDENGRAYVCEMRDYPYTDKLHHQPNQENPTDAPIGQVRLLEDSDEDGRFDRATVFADGLSWPTGVACWKGGVFVAATPDLWYLKDADGDGKAEIRRKVFSGFRKLNVQAVMNNLVWGLDNRIHGAGGSNGGQILPAGVTMTRQDFAFDPATDALELLSGGARFGGSFDDWGNRFLCNIRNPAQHIVLPAKYLARNRSLAAPSPLHDMAEAGDQLPVHRISKPEAWRVLRAKRWAGERDLVMPRSELVGAGVVTSASGVTSYRGAAYPERYRGNVFVCESASNLFYRLQLTPSGPTFTATRVDGPKEMVASTDNWFRPVNFINAPDGTLHVLDMYRENIEHPWSIPDDIHAAVDLENGRDMGRIWRLAPPGFAPSKPPRLGALDTVRLVETLENPNSWWRETAQRLLIERQDKAAVPPLRDLVHNSQNAPARLHALWTLHGLAELADDDLRRALSDDAPGVRRHAIQLAESRPGLLPLSLDDDASVRLQAAFSLGESADPRALDALAAIAKRDAGDPWIRTAVLSSVAERSAELLVRVLPDAPPDLVRELAQLIGVRGKADEMQRALLAERSTLPGIAEGLKRSGKSLRSVKLEGPAAQLVDDLLNEAARAVGTGDLASIRMLAFEEFPRSQALLARLLEPEQSPEAQLAAVAVIGSFSAPETAPMLLSGWPSFTPTVRAEVITAMLGARSRILPLLTAIDRGVIPANQVPFARRALLLRSTDPQVQELAQKYFSQTTGTRRDVIERYQPALSLSGDKTRGAQVFAIACAACHRAGETGFEVGPNLATIRHWNPDQILINILDPNREVAPNAVGYAIETKDGRSILGMIAEEIAGSVTIKGAGGVTETILRTDIAELNGSAVSLMPEGLEAAVTVEQMADLIAFLLSP